MVARTFVFLLVSFLSAGCSNNTTQTTLDSAILSTDDTNTETEPSPEPDSTASDDVLIDDVPIDDVPNGDVPNDSGIPTESYVIEDPGHMSNTASQLAEFYPTYGGAEAFPAAHISALEALLQAEDALIAGNPAAAGELVEAVFAAQPRGDHSWNLAPNQGTGGSNVGHPVAYYGLRMVEQIVAQGAPTGAGTLVMTGVIAPCASARRPRLPDLEPEVVDVTINPAILADQARRLFLATNLFRRWVTSITNGFDLQLQFYVLDTCTSIDYTDDGNFIFIYPNAQDMVDAVEGELADKTDIWWVISPSGVGATEEELGRHVISGGMGLTTDGRPLLSSEDLWFVRKPNHMGSGAWTEIELRAYHPQWFQHEFMHHIFRTWPEFGLEETGHQWFDRRTWPSDFEGIYEPDYYAEALTKRLLSASPSLAEGLQAPEVLYADELERADFAGSYQREPVANGWHDVTVTWDGTSLRWTNAAGASWGLTVRDDELWTDDDCPYGELPMVIEGDGGRIRALLFSGEAYRRIE